MKQNYGSDSQVQVIDRIARKKMISTYKATHESMQAGLKPPWVLFDTFMREADLMSTYKRYGREFFEEIRIVCSRFEKAFADNDIDLMVELYGDLEAIKVKAASIHS